MVMVAACEDGEGEAEQREAQLPRPALVRLCWPSAHPSCPRSHPSTGCSPDRDRPTEIGLQAPGSHSLTSQEPPGNDNTMKIKIQKGLFMMKSSSKPRPHSKITFTVSFSTLVPSPQCWLADSEGERAGLGDCKRVLRGPPEAPHCLGSLQAQAINHTGPSRGEGTTRGAASRGRALSAQPCRSRAARAGRAALALLLLNPCFPLGVCHPGWETEQERANKQTTDSEYRKWGGAAPNARAAGLQTEKSPP